MVGTAGRLRDLRRWVEEWVSLCKPTHVRWCDGSDAEYALLLDALVESGCAVRLAEARRPSSVLVRTDPRDAGALEDRLVMCTQAADEAGPYQRWEAPRAMKRRLEALFDGAMRGRTLYVVPFCLGPVGSPGALLGVQLTDSAYVAASVRLLARAGAAALAAMSDDSTLFRCVHSVGVPVEQGRAGPAWPCDPEQAVVAHFPQERTVISYGSGFGSAALLVRDSCSLRLASCVARDEGWLAEQMLVLGVESPTGEKTYVAAAFPDGCERARFARLEPPAELVGFRVSCVADAISWLRPRKDGYLHATSPLVGFHERTAELSPATDQHALAACQREAIFTNVALTADGDVWWEGLTETPPAGLVDWTGAAWTAGGAPAAHPNGRVTASARHYPNMDERWEDPSGVPISAVVFATKRRADMPLVYQAFNFGHGVYLGATLVTETGAEDTLSRDPMGMRKHCGYHLGDYFRHWLQVGKKLTRAPRVFRVNFHRQQDGRKLWPGLRHDARVLRWIVERSQGKAVALESPIGWIPHMDDIDWRGHELSESDWDELLRLDRSRLKGQTLMHEELFLELYDRLPRELIFERELLVCRL